jgi:hypothetical protein
MAIYLDQRVDNGLNDSSLPPLRKHELLRWHPKHELLMVASYADTHGGEINFFADDVGVVLVGAAMRFHRVNPHRTNPYATVPLDARPPTGIQTSSYWRLAGQMVMYTCGIGITVQTPK